MKIIKPTAGIVGTIDGQAVLKHIERCGRTCYKSEDKITDGSAEKFIKMLINSGHESVLEHFSFTAKFICDRGISHEAVRHRIASYSQESSRYCNYSNDKFDSSIGVIDIASGIQIDQKMRRLSADEINLIVCEWTQAMEDAEKHYMKMIELGATAQMARGVLPNSTKTEVTMTANLREWRHFFKLRTSKASHPQMIEVANILLEDVKKKIPIIFDDIGGE